MKQTELDFFNTINLEGESLKEAKRNANNQGERILGIFRDGNQKTPFDVLEAYNRIYPAVPITSIRRAISDLTDNGFLTKTDQMKNEQFGKPNYCWVINKQI